MKNKPLSLIVGAVLMAFGLMTTVAADLPARTFSHPGRIHYDRQCLTIDGKDTFIYSGSFHYFRCPKELWGDCFQKIKDAGFNTVETYVPWNWSEPQMPAGTNDFSKVNLTDLDDFLTMAEKFGLYVIIRPGPYICAEWDTGGYPRWLLTKKPAAPLRKEGWLRTDDPVYLAWCKHWYDAVCAVVAKHQITRKPPGAPGVILFQVENEYDFANLPDDVMINQVKALAEDAQADGIDVPLFTCWTHPVRGSSDPVLRQIFDACNFYPRWDVNSIQPEIEKLRRQQPDAPLATTELQGGWFSQVGGMLSEDQSGVTASQINNLTLFAIQNGDTIVNYYMLFGGTNPGGWAARDLTTSYDYNAPIREWGGIGDRYQRVWALGHFLQEHGAALARSEAVECDVTGTQPDVTVAERRAPDGGRYYFVRTSQHDQPREGTAHVKEKSAAGASEISFAYQLEPFGSKVLYLAPGVSDAAQGQWLPKPAPAIERPAELPAAVKITSARTQSDPGPTHWEKFKMGQNLAQLGIYDNDFVFYRGKISSRTATNLMIVYPASDTVLATINGKSAARVGGPAGGSIFALPAGSSRELFLYENHGHANIGPDLANPSGIFRAQLVSGPSGDGQPLSSWRMHLVDHSSGDQPEIRPEFNDADWPVVDVSPRDASQLTAGQTAVFRAQLQISKTDLASGQWSLELGRIDDNGLIYVNGEKVGETANWSQTYSFNVTKQLHPGTNIIAVIVRNHDGPGGLGAPSIERVAPLALDAFGRPAGFEEQWWQPDFNAKHWQTIAIGDDSAASANDSLLNWYRMDFQLPPTKPGVWVPWRLHLEAAGNGFLYLNGHALGRYWDVGPQHDFFLPECWLNFGDGRTNNLTLSLRPTGKATAIHEATVEPYFNFAEKR